MKPSPVSGRCAGADCHLSIRVTDLVASPLPVPRRIEQAASKPAIRRACNGKRPVGDRFPEVCCKFATNRASWRQNYGVTAPGIKVLLMNSGVFGVIRQAESRQIHTRIRTSDIKSPPPIVLIQEVVRPAPAPAGRSRHRGSTRRPRPAPRPSRRPAHPRCGSRFPCHAWSRAGSSGARSP